MSKRVVGTETHRRMERLISLWRKSGQSCTAFARANGVSVSTFFYWKRRLSPSPASHRSVSETGADLSSLSGTSRFLPVRLMASEAAVESSGLVELVLKTGERVRVSDGVSEETLRRVIRVLREGESC